MYGVVKALSTNGFVDILLSAPSLVPTVFTILGVSSFGGVTSTFSVSLIVSAWSLKVKVALFGIALLSYELRSASAFTLALIAKLMRFPAKAWKPSVMSKVTRLLPSEATWTSSVYSRFSTPATDTLVEIMSKTSSKSSLRLSFS